MKVLIQGPFMGTNMSSFVSLMYAIDLFDSFTLGKTPLVSKLAFRNIQDGIVQVHSAGHPAEMILRHLIPETSETISYIKRTFDLVLHIGPRRLVNGAAIQGVPNVAIITDGTEEQHQGLSGFLAKYMSTGFLLENIKSRLSNFAANSLIEQLDLTNKFVFVLPSDNWLDMQFIRYMIDQTKTENLIVYSPEKYAKTSHVAKTLEELTDVKVTLISSSLTWVEILAIWNHPNCMAPPVFVNNTNVLLSRVINDLPVDFIKYKPQFATMTGDTYGILDSLADHKEPDVNYISPKWNPPNGVEANAAYNLAIIDAIADSNVLFSEISNNEISRLVLNPKDGNIIIFTNLGFSAVKAEMQGNVKIFGMDAKHRPEMYFQAAEKIILPGYNKEPHDRWLELAARYNKPVLVDFNLKK